MSEPVTQRSESALDAVTAKEWAVGWLASGKHVDARPVVVAVLGELAQVEERLADSERRRSDLVGDLGKSRYRDEILDELRDVVRRAEDLLERS